MKKKNTTFFLGGSFIVDAIIKLSLCFFMHNLYHNGVNIKKKLRFEHTQPTQFSCCIAVFWSIHVWQFMSTTTNQDSILSKSCKMLCVRVFAYVCASVCLSVFNFFRAIFKCQKYVHFVVQPKHSQILGFSLFCIKWFYLRWNWFGINHG